MPFLSQLSRLSGLVAVLGGGAWIIGGSLLAVRPAAIWPITQRPVDDVLPWLGLGLLFILIGFGRLYSLHARHFPVWLKWGFLLTAIGSAPYVVGALAFLVGFTGSWVFIFTVPFFALVFGLSGLLIGVATFRAHSMPRWMAVLLIVSALALLGFNTQDMRAWLALPFGVGWLILGLALWSGKGLGVKTHSST